ncbi:hypothetical protein [Cytobacillus praedii]|uniref:hypothetical protein n=1 Tax=Cytobacillus praedii TaxID=1742358 RepID=UPI002E1C7BEF|nr:hypothetical protein [Cytobacillus praedii]
MSGWLNVGSFALGIIAWIMPIINLSRYKKNELRNWATLLIMSVSACTFSLCFQIFNTYHMVMIKDWSALMDTSGAVSFTAGVLLIVTILLNAITLITYRDRTRM